MATCLGAVTAVAQTSGTGSSSATRGTSDQTRSTTGSTTGTSTAQSSSMRSTSTELDRSDKQFIEKAAKSGMKEQALSQLAAQKATNPQVREYGEQLAQDHHKVNQQLMQLAQRKGVKVDAMKHAAMGSTMDAQLGTNSRTAGSSTTGSTVAGTSTASKTGVDRARADASGGTTTSGSRTGDAMGAAGAGMASMAMMDDRDFKNLAEKTGREFDEQYVKLMVKEHEDAVELFEEAAEDAQDSEIRSFARQHVAALREHLQEAKSLQRAVAE